MKPDFMFIGASKCATTSISMLLSQHPDIFMVSKETNFFSKDKVYAKGLAWYESFYNHSDDKQVRGERNNRYTMKEVFPNTISRIIDYAPDLKLIYCVRNPIHRIESYWLQLRSHGGEKVHYDFNTAVRVNRDWLVDPSNYWRQINMFRSYYSDEQILIIFYEDFQSDPEAILKRCFKFLDVDPNFPLQNLNLRLNPSNNKQIPTNSLSRLRSYPLLRTSAKLIPEQVLNFLKQKLFFKKVAGRPEWNPTTYAWTVDILREDTLKFLSHYGKPQDFWQI